MKIENKNQELNQTPITIVFVVEKANSFSFFTLKAKNANIFKNDFYFPAACLLAQLAVWASAVSLSIPSPPTLPTWPLYLPVAPLRSKQNNINGKKKNLSINSSHWQSQWPCHLTSATACLMRWHDSRPCTWWDGIKWLNVFSTLKGQKNDNLSSTTVRICRKRADFGAGRCFQHAVSPG